MTFTTDDYALLVKAVTVNPVTNETHPEQSDALTQLLSQGPEFVEALATWLTSDESVADYEDFSALLKALLLSEHLSLRNRLELLHALWHDEVVPFETISGVRQLGEVQAHFERSLQRMYVVDALALFKGYLHDFGPETSEEVTSDVNPWAIPLAECLDWGPLKPVITEMCLAETQFIDNKAVWNSLIETRLQLLDHSQLA